MPSASRINIILPPTDQQLADRIAAALGGGSRSSAIRYAIHVAARSLGLEEAGAGAPKKKRQALKKDA